MAVDEDFFDACVDVSVDVDEDAGVQMAGGEDAGV